MRLGWRNSNAEGWLLAALMIAVGLAALLWALYAWNPS